MSRTTTFYRGKNVQVATQPNIGLDASVRQAVIDLLNQLLADEAALARRTRRADEYAGRLGGPEQKELYDAQYQQINSISAELVERVQILGGFHLNSPEELGDSARHEEEPDNLPGIVSLLADQEAFIRFLREATQKCSEIYEDQGTSALLVSVIRIHEKMAWILRSNIGPE